MRSFITGACASLLAVSLSGCIGVPRLYRPAMNDGKPSKHDLAPKVRDIVWQISCELSHVSTEHLQKKNYLIQAQLTLQVDDEIYLTPSFTAITPLKIETEKRSFSQNLSLGGTRQRTFASTFYFDSDSLKNRPCAENGSKFYSLSGNLGLDEIARDGVGIENYQSAMDLKPKPKPLTFGSQIKFVVTRSVGALGPLWTLKRFTGPSGSNGLLNGKALTTDTLIIAFSEKDAPTIGKADQQIIDLLREIRDGYARKAEDAKKEAASKQNAFDGIFQSVKKGEKPFKSQALEDFALRSAQSSLESANKARDAAIAKKNEADKKLEEAQTEALKRSEYQNDANAMNANQSLINSIIFQNLNVQPK